MRRLLVVSMLLTLLSCRHDEGPLAPSGPQVVPITEDHSNIADPLERWRAYRLQSYQIDAFTICFCPPPQPLQKTIVLEGRETTTGWTVEEVFALVQDAAGRADFYRVTYDPRFGYPTEVWIDWNRGMADEEIGVELSHLEKLSP